MDVHGTILIFIQTASKFFYQTGLLIPKLLKIGVIYEAVGIGSFYRLGPYVLVCRIQVYTFKENFALKFTLDLAI